MLRSSGQLSKLGDKHKQPDLAQAHGIDRARPHSAKTTLSDLFSGRERWRDGETKTEREGSVQNARRLVERQGHWGDVELSS